jgi:hypothetical protein
LEASELGLGPASFVATTVKAYATPLLSPSTVDWNEDPAALSPEHVEQLGDGMIVYAVSGNWAAFGTVHVTIAEFEPAFAAETLTGATGSPNMDTVFDPVLAT